ncbi:MAG: hypothetical protein ACLQGV_06130 [Bryobacteraceae bacterium]
MSKKRSKPRKAAPPSPVRYSAFALAGAVLLLSLLAGLSLYQSSAAVARDTYAVGAQHDRLRQLDAELPREMVLGYLSDLPLESGQDQALFFGARYVLAPRLLVRAEQPGGSDWVLGNFVREVDPAAFAAAHRLRVAKLYGAGVVLFRGEGR